MIRTHVQLELRQYERLKALAARRSTSMAKLLREGVDHVLAHDQPDGNWDRLLAAAGSFRTNDGVTDASTRHDVYLADAFDG